MSLRTIVLAALSGVLLAASFPSFDAHFLAWIAFVPLLFALQKKTIKEGFWLGGITGIVFFTGTVYWVTNSVHFYGGIPIVLASLVTLLLCAYLALYPALFGAAVVHLCNRHPAFYIIIVPALWTSLELARTYLLSGFPWSLLGYSQYKTLSVIQISDVVGVYGVSFLVVLVNTAIAGVFLSKKKYTGFFITLIVMAAVLGYGTQKLRAPERTEEMIASVVQGNIEQDKKWDPAYQADTIGVYKRLTLAANTQHPDLVIWPETATPFYFNGARQSDQRLTTDLVQFVKEHRIPLLFGSPTFEIKPSRMIVARNSAFFLSPEGAVTGTYHKIHLVPFGEYVPFKSMLFFVEKMVQAIGDFQSGDEFTVMEMPLQNSGNRSIKVSTVICYEIIFPNLVRQFVNQGANVVTTITNDAWFGRTAAPYQHFSMAVFRAVENRVPVARAANTGVSGFIDAHGHILNTSGIFRETFLTQKINVGAEKTFYTRYGDLFSYACLLFILLMLVLKPYSPSRVHGASQSKKP